MSRREGTTRARVQKVREGRVEEAEDSLATEEPLEIRLVTPSGGVPPRSLSVTMRTPGHDVELAVGFLFTEGIIMGRADVQSIDHFKDDSRAHGQNIVEVTLAPDVPFDAARLQRNFYMTSSCGVCGKSSLDAIRVRGTRAMHGVGPKLRREIVGRLPERLREGQRIFESTGGLHGAGLFDDSGRLVSVHEDVGRHNAVDMVVGENLLADHLPLHGYILVVSGRASFEIMQKAAVAGIPFVVAVGAPSSLAVELAHEFGMTLVGFARGDTFNVYAGAGRIVGLSARQAHPIHVNARA